MNLVGIIILSAIGLFALIGVAVGSIKGFTRVKSWAAELALTGVISISRLVSSRLDGSLAPAIIIFCVTVALICVFMLLFAIFRTALKKRIEKRKLRSFYEHYDEREENTEQILNAVKANDKKQYKKLTKRKFKDSGGAWSVADRVFGGVVLAIKGAAIAGILSATLLTVLDFTRLPAEGGALYQTFGSLYSSGGWQFFKNYIFDFLLIGLIMICIKSGYSSGISSAVWAVLVIGMVAGAGYLSFHLAFNAPDFISVAEKLDGNLAPKMEGIAGILEAIGLSTLKLSQIIIGSGLFLVMLVAVILIAVFVPKLLDRAREGVIFRSIDGVFGAVILTAVIVGIIFALGAVLKTLYDLPFMEIFNAYFEKSGIATYFYDKNPLNFNLPIHGWLS